MHNTAFLCNFGHFFVFFWVRKTGSSSNNKRDGGDGDGDGDDNEKSSDDGKTVLM